MAGLPTAKEVSQALGLMLRCDVKVTEKSSPENLKKIAGIYSSSSVDKPIAILMSDIAFAAKSGAAFSMIPPDAAADCVKANQLDEFMQDNFGEIMNIFSRLFGEHDSKRILLTNRVFPPNAVPPEIQTRIDLCTKKIDLEIEIEKYGKGSIRMCLLP